MIIKPLKKHLETQFIGQPKKIEFCKKCVMSNQRPRISFKDGICSPCQYTEMKKKNIINYKERKIELEKLLDKHRSKNGEHDVIVPCSGGKDSGMIAHRLKVDYGMTPLCVTFSPPLYTEIGRKNLKSMIDAGFDHKLITPNPKLHKLLSKLCFIYLGDHEEIFDRGQLQTPIQEAYNNDIKLIMYGENGELEYGGDISTINFKGMPWDWYEKIYFSTPIDNIVKIAKDDGYFKYYDIPFSKGNLNIYDLPNKKDLIKKGIEFHWWGYYNKWIPQDNYYYSAKHLGFEANPEGRMEGTYSKYAQLDDATDSFLYYMMFIKYGIGRATSDASHEVRDGHITREEAVRLVRRFDGELPRKSMRIFLEYLDLEENEFWEVVDRFRRDHIWKRDGNSWSLKNQVS